MTAPAPVGRAPQRVLLVVAVGVLVVAVPATVLGGWLTGVSWDETYHVMRLTTFLEHGWYLLERDMLGSEPGPWEDQQYVYGPATTLLLHAWSVLWGVEGWSTVAASAPFVNKSAATRWVSAAVTRSIVARCSARSI